MFNHARTLLMNVDGSAPYDIPGEELVPISFRHVTLTQSLANARNVLFGTAPDRHMLNYRCKQFMQILHATDLARFVYDLDSRISYSLTADAFSPNIIFSRKVTPQGLATQPLFVMGTQAPPDASGRMQSVWIVKVVDDDTASAALLSPSIVTDQPYTMAEGLSSDVALPGSDLRVRFSETEGAQWRIQSLVRPARGPGQLLNDLKALPEENIVDIFQLASSVNEEPYKTFYQLWSKHHEMAYQLGSFLLAMIYSTDKLR